MADRRWLPHSLLLLALLGLHGCALNSAGKRAADAPANEALLQAVGNHSALIALYRQRLAETTGLADQDNLRLKLAQAYLDSGDAESALYYCQPVIDSGRSATDCLLVKSRALLVTGDHHGALAAAQAALAVRKDDAVILNQSGLVYADAGQYDQAREQFNRARERMLDDVTARNNLAMVDILEQQWDQAADRLMPLFRNGQADEKVTANLLLALARSGRAQEFMVVCGRDDQGCREYYVALSRIGRKGVR